jgi:hypothetical protein
MCVSLGSDRYSPEWLLVRGPVLAGSASAYVIVVVVFIRPHTNIRHMPGCLDHDFVTGRQSYQSVIVTLCMTVCCEDSDMTL